MRRIAFVYNPYSGKGKIRNHIADIIDTFAREDCEIVVVPTKAKGHCTDYIASQGERFETICVAGGDGTVNEAFNGLMQIKGEKPYLGYIPMGTTNDFASSCYIPTEPVEAAGVALRGKELTIDTGCFNQKYFCYVAAFGVFTSVAYGTSQQIKNLFGRAAYLVEGLKSLASVKSYKMKVEYNNNVIEDEFIFGMVANSTSVGGLKIKRFEVDLSDGLFEVLLLKKIEKATDINAILTDLMNKKMTSEYYYIFKTDKLKFSSHEAVAWTLDGEFGGEVNKAEVENANRAIKLRVAEE